MEDEVELDDEGKINEDTESGELLSRVQELEDELKNSEWKRMNLTHKNMALENNLKVCQEQKDHTKQENTSLKKKLVSTIRSQVRRVEGVGQSSRVLHKYSPWATSLNRISLLSPTGWCWLCTDSSKWHLFNEVFCIAFMPYVQIYVPLSLMCGYIHTTHYLVCCAQMYVCCPIFASVLCIAHLCTHCAAVLLCRIPRRWWQKVSAGSFDTSLLPSSPTDQAEGSREMEGEVAFRRDTKSNLLKAVSGTEWMYRRGALERGRRVSVNAVVFVLCGYKCGFAHMSVCVCMCLSTL